MNNHESIYDNFQLMYLPEYTSILRQIEKEIDEILKEVGFQECLFPKLIELSKLTLLKNANNRFETEWNLELIETDDIKLENKNTKFALPHWQCEPFYFFLKKNPGKEFKFFDHSGWSYRVEKTYDKYRLFEFLRTEVVFCVKKNNSEIIYLKLLHSLFDYFKDTLKFDVRLVEKNEEQKETSEKRVIDIEAKINDTWIEIVGCHLHGDIFIKALNIEENINYDTGCCGIGLHRIVNIILSSENKLL